MQIPIDLEKALLDMAQEAYEAGKQYIKYKETANLLDKMKDIKLQDITNRQEGKSDAEKRRKALATDEWDTYLTNLSNADTIRDKWKIEKDNKERMWSTYQMLLSSKNSERRFTSGSM